MMETKKHVYDGHGNSVLDGHNSAVLDRIDCSVCDGHKHPVHDGQDIASGDGHGLRLSTHIGFPKGNTKDTSFATIDTSLTSQY